ncbi:hypothetical protein LCGC14_1391890 [marine sediment metagenome]|uniref:Phage ABA sandwich domain-containing protein n=1 Tax=marine sediment metagenome TaxID=412755 RepID=A0A0F9KKL0_9ZZZZ
MDELNKKLAEWAVPAAVEIQVQEKQIVIETDEGTGSIELLTESLDACFKLLVPNVDFGQMELYLLEDGSWLYHLNYVGKDDKGYSGRGINPALALCLAIEKLIDSESK